MSPLDVDSPTKLKVTYADHTVEQLTKDGKWADHWDLLRWQLVGIMKMPKGSTAGVDKASVSFGKMSCMNQRKSNAIAFQ